jgi:hypothetical protein
MAFNIAQFKSSGLYYGGARPALFEVVIAMPTGVDLNTTSAAALTYVCRAAELPPASLGVALAPYFGRDIKLAGDREFPDWPTTVMNDEDFSVRSFLEAWSNSINKMESNHRDPRLAANEGYKVDLTVTQYSKDSEPIRQYSIIGAWPREIEGIELNWDAKNTVEEFRCTWSYDYWIPVIEQSSKNRNGTNPFADKI